MTPTDPPADTPARPTAPPTVPGAIEPPKKADGVRVYRTASETVGLLPSIRLGDNLIQGAVVLACTGIGALAGYLLSGRVDVPWWAGTLGGGAGAMILSTLVSGLVLMVLGWVRAFTRK